MILGKPATAAGKSLIPPHERGIAMVFQDLGLWPNLTVAENIGMGTSPQLGRQEKINQIMALLSIGELANRKPSQLSGGQQQRVALGAALVSKPKLLLLDEPFTGLDWLTKERLLEEIRRIVTEKNISVVMVSHDPFEARSLCNQVMTLDEGKVLDFGTWEEVLKTPQSPILNRLKHLRS